MSRRTVWWGRRALRLTGLVLILVEGLLKALVLLPWAGPELRERQVRSWSRRLLAALGVQIEVAGERPAPGVRGVLFVSNHVSWLDIFALNSVNALHFVSKAEVRGWPVLGWLAARAGTLFIERGRRRDTGRINREAAAALDRGECVGFFPEATTTDGRQLRPFHTSLLQAAIDARVPVWPVGIRYLAADGTLADAAAFIDDMTFAESLMRVIGEPQIRARLVFAAPLRTEGRNRRELAHLAEQAIAQALCLPVPHRGAGTPADLPAAAR